MAKHIMALTVNGDLFEFAETLQRPGDDAVGRLRSLEDFGNLALTAHICHGKAL